MTALFCALISGICFYFSFALGAQWWLAWLAPIPVLWLAFGKTNWRIAGLACWAAVALGTLNLLPAYAGELPVVVLVVPIVLLGLSFAALALGARFVARRISPLAGVLAFAALWTGSDFLMSLGNNGTAVSPAYSQVGAAFDPGRIGLRSLDRDVSARLCSGRDGHELCHETGIARSRCDPGFRGKCGFRFCAHDERRTRRDCANRAGCER